MVLTAEGIQELALRVRWLLGRARPGLLSVLLAHLGYASGTALLSPVIPSVLTMYGTWPGFRLGVAGRKLVIVLFAVGGAFLGLWADSRTGVDRRQSARLTLWALLPGTIIAVLGFIVGRIVFGILHIPVVWRWGVMGVVLAAEGVLAWWATTRTQALLQRWDKVWAKLSAAASKLTWPDFVTNVWSKLESKLLAAPASGWLGALTLTTLIAVAGTMTLLAPQLTYIVVALLPWVVSIVILLLVVAAVGQGQKTN
jgi:hypothetical protein